MTRKIVPNEKIQVSKSNLKEGLLIFRYLKPYRAKFICGLVFIALSAGTTMAFPYLLKELLSAAQEIQQGRIPRFTPGQLAGAMIAVLTIQMVFSYMRIYLFTEVGERGVADMRQDLYKKIIRMPVLFFDERRVGELSNRINTDVTQIQDAITSVLAGLLRGVLTMVIGLILIIYLSPRLTLVMLCIVPLIVVLALIFSRKIRKYARASQDQLAQSGTVVHETLTGIHSVKAYTNEWFEQNRYLASLSEAVRLAVKNGRYRGAFVSFLLFSVFGAVVVVVWYATYIQMNFADLSAFIIYTAFVAGTMAGFADLYSQLQKTLGATQRVRELLREETEPVSLQPVHIEDKFRLKGEVQFRNLAFAYPTHPDSWVLNNINIHISRGTQIALVGPSGAGKSTFTSLLLCFYSPTQGEILFDGKPAADYPLSQLRNQMARVPQEILLFGGTVYENIIYGRPDASEREVYEAARQANALEFIERMPKGFHTTVGERGVKLSGGQRQRIAIARAILRNPVILILDEATSALDSESEQSVQEALENLMKNRTSFVIAHRLSTIRHADLILVMEQGRIVESGTHEELINKKGLYASLSELQFQP